MNFTLFWEDPTFHSVVDVYIPIVGQAVAFACLRWPPVRFGSANNSTLGCGLDYSEGGHVFDLPFAGCVCRPGV
jgi:hypothetical protein